MMKLECDLVDLQSEAFHHEKPVSLTVPLEWEDEGQATRWWKPQTRSNIPALTTWEQNETAPSSDFDFDSDVEFESGFDSDFDFDNSTASNKVYMEMPTLWWCNLHRP